MNAHEPTGNECTTNLCKSARRPGGTETPSIGVLTPRQTASERRSFDSVRIAGFVVNAQARTIHSLARSASPARTTSTDVERQQRALLSRQVDPNNDPISVVRNRETGAATANDGNAHRPIERPRQRAHLASRGCGRPDDGGDRSVYYELSSGVSELA
jgi:hypothetical protein